jgi:hypothetical protein
MKTGINFNKKLALDNIKNIDINNYKSNNNTNNKKHRHYSSRLTSYNVTNCTNNDIVNSLEFKLEKKRIKIKNLETNIIYTINYFKCSTSNNSENCNYLNNLYSQSSSKKFVDKY